MKLLHVIPSFAPAWRYGGPVVAAHGLTRELARQGHDVTVMTTNIDGPGVLDVPTESAVLIGGVEVWYFPVQRPRWYYFSRPLGQTLRERVSDFDIVHIHSIFLWPTTIAAYWSRRRGVPYLIRPAGSLDPVVLTKAYLGWRDSLPSRVRKWVYLNTLGRWDINGAAGIHFTSQAELEASRTPRFHPPGYVLPLGVDLSGREEATGGVSLRERYPQLAGKKIVLFLSRLDPKKGLDILILALADLATKRSDFALVVAGSGASSYQSQVASMVEKHGLGDRTVFLGLVQGGDKWSVLRDADVFVLPSYRENFGVAVVEAMATGLPVVISDRVNIHQEVSAAGAGLITSLDPGEVARATETLLNDEALRRKMGAAGEVLAGERFSWERVGRSIVREYEKIISTRQRALSDAMHSSTK